MLSILAPVLKRMKGSMTGFGSEHCCTTTLGMKCANVKVYFEIVHVHICI